MKRCFFIFIISMLICKSGFSLNRINHPTDTAKRCMKIGIHKKTCEKMRKEALKINCISKEEYNTLKKYGSYPSCNLLKGEGLEMLDGWCPCGCFHPSTYILAYDMPQSNYTFKSAINILENKNTTQLVHLGKKSTLDKMYYKKSKIRITTKGKELQHMIVIETKEHPKLIVTRKHPIVISPGKIIKAANLKKHHKLINSNGSEIDILHIKKIKFAGNVVNFSTESSHPLEHLIIANGILTGDQYWQASLEDKFNRIIIRKKNQ